MATRVATETRAGSVRLDASPRAGRPDSPTTVPRPLRPPRASSTVDSSSSSPSPDSSISSHLSQSESSSYDSDAEEELECFDVDPFQKPLPRIDEQLFFALRDVAPDLVVGAVASVRIARRREAFGRSISRPRFCCYHTGPHTTPFAW